jgi:hypothetical protein
MTTGTPILKWPQLLAEVGRYLYGEVSWQRQLAESLQHPHLPYQGVDLQTLKKWASGKRSVPWWVANDLLRLIREVTVAKAVKENEVTQGLLTQMIRAGQA